MTKEGQGSHGELSDVDADYWCQKLAGAGTVGVGALAGLDCLQFQCSEWCYVGLLEVQDGVRVNERHVSSYDAVSCGG